MGEAARLEVLLEQVHQLHHLREDEHAVPHGLELREDPVEQLKLARGSPEVGGRLLPLLLPLVLVEEEEGVVAHLPQLHLHIVEPRDLERAAVADRAEPLLLYLAVHELLLKRNKNKR